MTKTRSLLCVLTVAGVVAGTSSSLRAACGGSVTFGQGGDEQTGYSYVVSPGTSDTAASLVGHWWALGTGNPSLGAGDDDGSQGVAMWLRPYGGSSYMGGDWIQPGTDGCIAEVDFPSMVAAFSDQSMDGLTGYFAVAAVDDTHNQFALSYDFSFVGAGAPQDITLVPIPTPQVDSVTPGAGVNTVALSWSQAEVDAGIYTDVGSAGATLVPTYRVYYSNGPSDPTTRSLEGQADGSTWTEAADTDGDPANAAAVVDVPEPGAGDESWVALRIDFDSGFATDYVGASAMVGAPAPLTVALECSCLATCPGPATTYIASGENNTAANASVLVAITNPTNLTVLDTQVPPGPFELRKTHQLPGSQPPPQFCPITPTYTVTVESGADSASATCNPEWIITDN